MLKIRVAVSWIIKLVVARIPAKEGYVFGCSVERLGIIWLIMFVWAWAVCIVVVVVVVAAVCAVRSITQIRNLIKINCCRPSVADRKTLTGICRAPRFSLEGARPYWCLGSMLCEVQVRMSRLVLE